MFYLNQPAKKRRLGLGTAALDSQAMRANMTIEMQQLQLVPTSFSDNSEVTASSSAASVVSPIFATSEVTKRDGARAVKRALDSTVQKTDEHDNIARQLEASSKRRRKMERGTLQVTFYLL